MSDPIVLQKEPTPEPVKEVKAQADIDIKAKPPADKTTLDFKNSDLLKKYVQQPTQSSQPSQSSGPSTTLSVDEIRDKMKKEEEEEAKKLSVEDFEDIADLIMDIFDTVAIFAIRWYAQDDIDGPYQIPTDRMKKLKHRLSRLLMRMQAKIPMGFLFFAGLLMAYATPVRKAHAHRKEKMARQREFAIQKAKLAQQNQLQSKSATQNIKQNTTQATKKPATSAAPTHNGTVPPPVNQEPVQTPAQQSESQSISPTVILDKDGNVIVKRPKGRPPK